MLIRLKQRRLRAQGESKPIRSSITLPSRIVRHYAQVKKLMIPQKYDERMHERELHPHYAPVLMSKPASEMGIFSPYIWSLADPVINCHIPCDLLVRPRNFQGSRTFLQLFASITHTTLTYQP